MTLQPYHAATVEYLRERTGRPVSVEEIAEGLGLKPTSARKYLTQMRAAGVRLYDDRAGRWLMIAEG